MHQHLPAVLLATAVSGTLLAGPVAGAPDGTQGVAVMSATVRSEGELRESAGAVSSERVGVGFYRVVFNRDINACVRVAGVGRTAGSGFLTGTATTAFDSFGTVQVFTTDPNAADVLVDRDFHLIVFCAE